MVEENEENEEEVELEQPTPSKVAGIGKKEASRPRRNSSRCRELRFCATIFVSGQGHFGLLCKGLNTVLT